MIVSLLHSISVSLSLPWSSTLSSYLSGRQAVSVSRRTEGMKGFYTMVYDDVDGSPLLAYFTPTGKACCYYPSGALHMLCDREGGTMFSEVRKSLFVLVTEFKTKKKKKKEKE